MARLFCDSLSQQNSIKGKSGEINAFISIIHDQLRQSPGSGGRKTASVTSKATGEPHVAHVRMGTNDRTAVKIVVIIVYWLTLHYGRFIEPDETQLTQITVKTEPTLQICPAGRGESGVPSGPGEHRREC